MEESLRQCTKADFKEWLKVRESSNHFVVEILLGVLLLVLIYFVFG